MEESVILEQTPADEPKKEEYASEAQEMDTDDSQAVNEPDYSSIVEDDLKTLRESFRELRELSDITELENPLRFAKLRDAGFSAVEAYLECTKQKKPSDNRSHLHSSLPISRSAKQSSMSREELQIARELFPEASDAEIQKLYKSVTR